MLSTSTFGGTSGTLPLVFYGTCFAFGIMIIGNLLWLFVYMIVIRRDEGFQEYRKQYCLVPHCLLVLGSVFSYKVARFMYCRFFGQDHFYVNFKNHNRFHCILNCLTIMNIVLTLLPIIFVDIYGLVRYHWGGQFYIIMIETLILTITILILSIIEFKASKRLDLKPTNYQEVGDMSSVMEDTLMKKLEDRLRERLGAGFDSMLNRLRGTQQPEDIEKQRLKRGNSMVDVGTQDKEEDERRVNTDPLDSKKKKIYDSRPNPFEREIDHDHPNNCYAERAKRPKTPVPNDQ